jgi:hypothetical protein
MPVHTGDGIASPVTAVDGSVHGAAGGREATEPVGCPDINSGHPSESWLLTYVPDCQERTYCSCSGVIVSISLPRALSLRRATSRSISSGTT